MHGKKWNNLGDVLYRVGDFPTVIHDFDKGFQAYTRAEGQYGRSFVLAGLGDLLEATPARIIYPEDLMIGLRRD